ncbi:spindle assembly abnormal protein 6 homolog isoform X2 [Liolophura sinensis]
MDLQTVATSPLSQELVVRLTVDQDPSYLYILRLNKEDFQSFKTQQGLREDLDFRSFPQKFIDLLNKCILEEHSKVPKFSLHLVSESSATGETTAATLNVIETNLKRFTHLSPHFLPGKDADIKKYLADCLKQIQDLKDGKHQSEANKSKLGSLKEEHQRAKQEIQTQLSAGTATSRRQIKEEQEEMKEEQEEISEEQEEIKEEQEEIKEEQEEIREEKEAKDKDQVIARSSDLQSSEQCQKAATRNERLDEADTASVAKSEASSEMAVEAGEESETIYDLTGKELCEEELSILRLGLNHSLASRPKVTDIFAEGEALWKQLEEKKVLPRSTIHRAKIREAIQTLALNFVIYATHPCSDYGKINVLRNLKRKYVVLKADEGNGIVVIKKMDYDKKMEELFSDTSKFQMLKSDPTLKNLEHVQHDLKALRKKEEISEVEYMLMYPKRAKPARAIGLPKIHKDLTDLPEFRPVIDTIGSPRHKVSKFLADLLSPLTYKNGYKLKDSLDCAKQIRRLPDTWFTKGFEFVFVKVVHLMNVPLEEIIPVILTKVYKEKLINTSLKEETMEKLIRDCCTKTPFLFNGTTYEQTDGIWIGSPLAPVMTDIIMSKLEDKSLPKLYEKDIVKFYRRFVDDILLVIQPLNVDTVLSKFNAFHEQFKFTCDDDNNHFLDLSITDIGITIFRNPTDTGQFTHFLSNTPWNYKISWVKALIRRAKKICSTKSLFDSELCKIRKFYHRKDSLKLLLTN